VFLGDPKAHQNTLFSFSPPAHVFVGREGPGEGSG
jgi:hypothetical protein